MDSLFSVLAKEDNETRTASRKAIIAANQRIVDTVGAFIQRASNVEERDQRIALVGGDIESIVASACADYGGDIEQITKSVRERLANTCVCGGDPSKCQCGKKTTKEASTHESRKPRMCPYHKQVTDISLAQGEPKAGYEAMSQHSWSDKHCESDDYKGDKCKFKPEMTTQSYWTDRSDKAREKREERQQVEQEQQIQESPTTEESEPTEYTIDTTEWENEGGSDDSGSLDSEMQNAPSAITSEPEVVSSLHTAASYNVQQLTDGSGRWKVVGPGGTSQGVYDTQQEAQAEANTLNRGLNNQNQSSRQAAPNMMQTGPAPPQISGDPNARLDQGALADGFVQPLNQQALADGHVQPQGPAAPTGAPQPTPAMQNAMQMMNQAPGAAQIPPHPNNPGQQQQGVLNQIAPAGGQQAPGGAVPGQPNPLMPSTTPYENFGVQKGYGPSGAFSSVKQAINISDMPMMQNQQQGYQPQPGTPEWDQWIHHQRMQMAQLQSVPQAAADQYAIDDQFGRHGPDGRLANGNDNLGGPSPKMDKRKWTPQNLQQRVNTEGSGSPHPTKEVDITEPIVDERSDDFLEGTRAVTETQDVTKSWTNDGSGKTKTFDGAGQAVPVTSSSNPLFDLLEPSQVTSAISQYREE